MDKNLQGKYQASVDFLQIFPQEYQSKLQKLIWQVPASQRNKIWEDENVPYKEIEEAFIKLTEQRNTHAKEKGFKSNLEYFLSLYKISENDYAKFSDKFKKAIDYCNPVVFADKNTSADFLDEFGDHCYLCLSSDFPIENLKAAESMVNTFDSSLFPSKNEIKIVEDDASFSKRNVNFFEIHINKNQNLRHQSVDLIHEMFHGKNKDNSQNKYQSEKKVVGLEIAFYKKLNTESYKALLGEFLKVFHRVLFEIELYKNPNQDLSKLYANVFNQCYKGANQSKNRSYILDDLIIRYPFLNLPHALAQAEVLSTLNK